MNERQNLTREELLREINRILKKATGEQLRKVSALISALDK